MSTDNKEFAKLMLGFAAIIVAICLFAKWVLNDAVRISSTEHQNTYSAWCKFYGNSNRLTFDEWRQLKNADLLPK